MISIFVCKAFSFIIYFRIVEFCEKLFEDTGVAMLPGSDFGRQLEEMITRIAYVDFNGSRALEAAESYSENGLDEEFVKKYCG